MAGERLPSTKNLAMILCACAAMCSCGSGGAPAGNTAISSSIFVSISPSAQTSILQGQSVQFNATVENDSSGDGVTWQIAGAGGTVASMGTFTDVTSTSAIYNATPLVASPLSVTVTAASITNPKFSSSTVVVINPSLTITTASLPVATPDVNYVAYLQATGGVGALTWSLNGGALPQGLTLNRSGAITGVPSSSGVFAFTAQVSDSLAAPVGPDWTQAELSLTVVPPLSVVSTSLPSGAEGTPYLAGLAAAGGVAPYTWTVTQGSLPPGLILQSGSGVISGIPTSQGSFTFTVAVSDSSPTPQTRTQSLAISLSPPSQLAIATTGLLNATVGAPYAANLLARGGAPPYTWTISAGALPANFSLNPASGAISGTASIAGAASFSVAVTDSGSPPSIQSQPLTMAIASPAGSCENSGNNSVLTGPYAFSLSGFSDAGFLTVVGSFTADGSGHIIAGEADTNGFLGAQQANILPSASSYSVGVDDFGCATLATQFGTFVTHFTLGSISSGVAAQGRMIEWDSPSTGALIAAGKLLRQSSGVFAGGLEGSYVFRNVGRDSDGRIVCVGVLSASGNALSGVEEDCNDAWNVTYQAEPASAGTVTPVDSNGRGAGMLTILGTNSLFAFYMVSGSQMLVVNADSGPYTSGEWDLQTLPASGSGFGQSSLAGNMVFHLSGLGEGGTATAVSAETANADGISSLSMTFYEDLAGTLQSPGAYTCGYDVESSGRVTLSAEGQSCGGTPPVLYLTGQDAGLVLDASPGVDTGAFEPQTGAPFSNSMLEGTFLGGIEEVALQPVLAEVDAIAPSGISNITGQLDVSSVGAQEAGEPFAANIWSVNPDGTFILNTSGGAVAGIVISSSKFLLFSPASFATPYPTLLVMQK